MRFALIALLLAGCHGGGRDHGVAWPQRAEREADDKAGESLAPRQARAIAADGVAATEDVAGDKPASVDKPAAVDGPKVSAPTPGAPPPPDDSLFGDDDITIEVTE